MKNRIENLTKHPVTILRKLAITDLEEPDEVYDDNGNRYEILYSILPSGVEARCGKLDITPYAVVQTEQGRIPLFTRKFNEIYDLPDENDEAYYIVSQAVKQALPERQDLVCPGNTIRCNDAIVGCLYLQI